MKEGYATKFLDNIIDTESDYYQNIFGTGFQKGKENILFQILKIVACKEIFKPEFKHRDNKLTWYLNQGLGYWIYDLRQRKVSDEEIYKAVLEARDDFLKIKSLRGFSYETILRKKQCLEVYNAVKDRLSKEIRKLEDVK